MRILVADDHPLYLEALERQLSKAFRSAEVRGVPSLEGLYQALGDGPADLVVLDFSLSGTQRGGAVHQVVTLAGNAPVIIVSGVADVTDVQDCVTAGARGYLPKTMQPRLFADAVSLVLHGGTYLPIETALAPPPAVPPIRNAEQISADGSSLDSRDRELLQMIADGLSNKEIATNLGVQESTVKFYVSRLFRRLGVKNRSQAASWAARAE